MILNHIKIFSPTRVAVQNWIGSLGHIYPQGEAWWPLAGLSTWTLSFAVRKDISSEIPHRPIGTNESKEHLLSTQNRGDQETVDRCDEAGDAAWRGVDCNAVPGDWSERDARPRGDWGKALHLAQVSQWSEDKK